MKRLVNGLLVEIPQSEVDEIEASNVIQRELAKIRAEKLKASDLKLEGVLFEGVMCSATGEDMWGLSSIRLHIQAGGEANFYFKNGNILKLTLDNYAAFEAVWIPFRASFFTDEG